MVKRIEKIFIIISVIFTIIFLKSAMVEASLVKNAQSESGHKPVPPTPPDDNNNYNTRPVDSIKLPEITEINEYEYYYETISGNVYEEIGEIFQERNRR